VELTCFYELIVTVPIYRNICSIIGLVDVALIDSVETNSSAMYSDVAIDEIVLMIYSFFRVT